MAHAITTTQVEVSMSERRNPSPPPHVRVSDRRQAERVAAITDPRYPSTGTARISALLAAAKTRENEQRLAEASARRGSTHTG